MPFDRDESNTYNLARGYSEPAIRIIQREVGMGNTSGVFTPETADQIFSWQGSSTRVVRLTTQDQDGKMGPTSLGIMIVELNRAGRMADANLLGQFPNRAHAVSWGKRFIFYGGARERNNDGSTRQVGIAHNSAFQAAAVNVRRDYRDFNSTGQSVKIETAERIVLLINRQADNTIKSLDILSHATPWTLNFSINDD